MSKQEYDVKQWKNEQSKENSADDILASQYVFDLPVYTRNTESTVT